MAVTKLIQNLESQVEMHQVLLEALIQELALPASCSLLELEETQTVRNATVRRIAELEASRLSLVNRYKAKKSISGDISLSDIINACDIEEKKRLSGLKKQLSDVIAQIRRTSKENAEKATARVACFKEIHNSIHKNFHRHPVYSMNGTMNELKGACLIKRSI
jgi:hypothetical protein